MRLPPETCRVKPLRRIKTQLLHHVGLISWPYTALYSWWWVRLSPETCRVKPLQRIKMQLLHLVGLISLQISMLLSFKIETQNFNNMTFFLEVQLPRFCCLIYKVYIPRYRDWLCFESLPSEKPVYQTVDLSLIEYLSGCLYIQEVPSSIAAKGPSILRILCFSCSQPGKWGFRTFTYTMIKSILLH